MENIKNSLKFLVVLCWFSAMAVRGYAKSINLYVSDKGNDSWSGTSAVRTGNDGPLLTIQAAIDKLGKLSLAQGDAVTIQLVSAMYPTEKPINISNVPQGSSVSIVGYNGRQTTISGFKNVAADRILDKGSYWEIDVSDNPGFVSQIKVNGAVVKQSVYPSSGFSTFKSVSQNILKDRAAKNTLSDSALQVLGVDDEIAANLKNSSSADVLIFSKWHFIRRAIRSVNGSAIQVVGQEMSPDALWKSGTRYQIANSSMGFTAGTWMYDRNTKKVLYKPKNGESARSATVSVPATDILLNISGASVNNRIQNITIKGITFEGGGYDLSGKGILPMQAASGYNAAVNVNNAVNVDFQDCVFTNISLNALWFNQSVTNSSIVGCLFENFGMGAIRLGEPKPNGVGVKLPCTGSNTIQNCIIQNGGLINASGVGIAIFQSGNNTVRNNEIADLFYTGISAGWTWGNGNSYATNNHIENNNIHHIGKGVLDDMGGIYLLGNSSGTTVKGNLIHHIYSYDYGGWGIYLDQGSANVDVSNNIVLNTKSGSYFQSIAKNINVSNNVFVNSDIHQLQLGLSSSLPDTSVFFHNNYIIRQSGVWFAGPWSAKGIYLKDNAFITDTNDRSKDKDNLKLYSLKDVNSRFGVNNNTALLMKDNYNANDIKSILTAFKINMTCNGGVASNKFAGRSNSRVAGYYSGFNSRMKSTTLFRKDQVGR